MTVAGAPDYIMAAEVIAAGAPDYIMAAEVIAALGTASLGRAVSLAAPVNPIAIL